MASRLRNLVCMLVLNEFTNDSRVFKEAQALQTAGCNVTVLALHGTGLALEEILPGGATVRRLQLATRRFRWKIFLPIKYTEFGLRALAHMLRAAPEVCHSHDFITLPFGFIYKALKRSQVKLVYDIHELWFEQHDYPPRPILRTILTNIGYALEGFMVRRADRMITVGPMLARHFGQRHHVPAPVVLRNIPDIDAVAQRPEDLNQRLGIPTDFKIALYVGKLSSGRGLERIVDAMVHVQEHCALVLMGDGALRPSLEERARELGLLGERVFFHEPVPPAEVLAHLTGASIGLSPIENKCLNSYFCLPNKLFEYLSIGIPVLVTDLPEMASFVREHGVGDVLDDASPQSIASAIDRLLVDRPAYLNMQERAKAITVYCRWENEKRVLIELYSALVPLFPHSYVEIEPSSEVRPLAETN